MERWDLKKFPYVKIISTPPPYLIRSTEYLNGSKLNLTKCELHLKLYFFHFSSKIRADGSGFNLLMFLNPIKEIAFNFIKKILVSVTFNTEVLL